MFSSVFSVSLGFIPVTISILSRELITQGAAIYIDIGMGIIGIYLFYRRKRLLIPSFILHMVTGVLVLLSITAFISGDYVPSGTFLLTLKISILIPTLGLYMHKKRSINHFLKQVGSCNKRLYVRGTEAAVVSARTALILGILHFIIISVTAIFQSPLSKTSLLVLHKALPPTVFLMNVLFNQIATRFFNHLMSHTEYVPTVNAKGDVIGEISAVKVVSYRNIHINPVIRIVISIHGMLFLYDRPLTAILSKGKVDIPMGCYLRYRESLEAGAIRPVNNAFPHGKGTKPKFNTVYRFENKVASRLIYLFVVDIKGDSILYTPYFRDSKLWNFEQIEESLGKGFFGSYPEDGYGYLKGIIYIREKYRES